MMVRVEVSQVKRGLALLTLRAAQPTREPLKFNNLSGKEGWFTPAKIERHSSDKVITQV